MRTGSSWQEDGESEPAPSGGWIGDAEAVIRAAVDLCADLKGWFGTGEWRLIACMVVDINVLCELINDTGVGIYLALPSSVPELEAKCISSTE